MGVTPCNRDRDLCRPFSTVGASEPRLSSAITGSDRPMHEEVIRQSLAEQLDFV